MLLDKSCCQQIYGNIIRDVVSHYVIKHRFSSNEQLIQTAAVNWDGTKKIIELRLLLCHLKPAVICKSYGVQENFFLVL